MVTTATTAGTTEPETVLVAKAGTPPPPSPGRPPGALSERNANYSIEVRLDPIAHMLDGHEIITWRNIQPLPTAEIWFHLYYNAWKNTHSTWMRELRFGGRRTGALGRDLREDDWSYCDVVAVKTADGAVLPTRFAHPDDENKDDQTVLLAALPRPVAPGESITIDLTWKSKIPRTFARTGFRGNFYFLAQWFPKVGVYEANGAWNCHQFHSATEFFSDYGSYDVRLTLPRGWVVGATGTERESHDAAGGFTTHRFQQDDVHDFAWTTSPDYRVREATFAHPALPSVRMRLLLQPEHERQAERHFAATRAALQYYGTWYGPYPYDHITIVDPAWNSGAGGMEYPTLFTAGTRWLQPEGSGSPEGVTVHECGHQFWYGIVGNNEFEHAWLDEGFNTFSTARTMDVAFGETPYSKRYFGGFVPWMFRDALQHRITGGNRLDGYRTVAKSDAPSSWTFHYYPATASGITYNKTALWLSTLERMLGWDVLQKVMATHFDRWKFQHPKPDDYFAELNDVSGRDLTWFIDQAYRSSNVFDYGVEDLWSDPAGPRGLVDESGRHRYVPESSGGAGTLHRSTVVVRRYGEAIFPVDVLITFDNGEQVRERWNEQYRWKAFTFEKPTRVKAAQVDPGRTLVLDINYTNNSRVREPHATLATTKWASKWMVWFQDFLMTFSFFL